MIQTEKRYIIIGVRASYKPRGPWGEGVVLVCVCGWKGRLSFMSGRVVEVSAREMGPVCLGVWNCVAEGRRDVVWRDQCLTDGMRVEEGGMGRGQHDVCLCLVLLAKMLQSTNLVPPP